MERTERGSGEGGERGARRRDSKGRFAFFARNDAKTMKNVVVVKQKWWKFHRNSANTWKWSRPLE